MYALAYTLCKSAEDEEKVPELVHENSSTVFRENLVWEWKRVHS